MTNKLIIVLKSSIIALPKPKNFSSHHMFVVTEANNQSHVLDTFT